MKKIVLVLAILLTACGSSAEQHPVVVLPQMLATAEPYIDPSYPTVQVEVAAPDQTASGIDVRLQSVSMEGKNVNADVCFTLPDTSDWGIQSASLTYAGTVVEEFGTTLQSFQEPANGTPGLRCDTLTFVVPPDADLTNAAIMINSIGTTVREGDYCSVYMPKIQQAMLDRNTGISVDCVDVNGVLTMQILSMPAGMTQEQAEQIVYSDEFYTVKGPWSFPFGLAQ